ncbi:MAG TPA: glycosyltransferase 87 family protein, partial [Thermoanaerobaculia bacterium]
SSVDEQSARRRHHGGVATALLAIAAGIKLTPLAAFPVMMRDRPHRLRHAGVFLLTFTTPIALAGMAMPGLLPYATRWSFNSPLYLLARRIAEQVPAKAIWTAIKDPLRLERISGRVYSHLHPDFMARALLAIGLVLVLIVILRRVRETDAAVADSLAALLLFSPTIHPWYWLVVLPFALLASRALWLWLAMFSPLSYLMYEPSQHIGDPSQTVVMLLCYSIPAIGWLLTRSRLRHEKTR